jgi:DNA-binding NtrC family response regulator
VHQAWPEIPGIVLCEFNQIHQARKALNIEIFDFLAKPCALGELEHALELARQRRVRLLPTTVVLPPPPAEEPIARDDLRRQDHATLEDIERQHILATLEKNAGNRTRTAAELGISLRKLYYRLGQYHREGLLPR